MPHHEDEEHHAGKPAEHDKKHDKPGHKEHVRITIYFLVMASRLAFPIFLCIERCLLIDGRGLFECCL